MNRIVITNINALNNLKSSYMEEKEINQQTLNNISIQEKNQSVQKSKKQKDLSERLKKLQSYDLKTKKPLTERQLQYDNIFNNFIQNVKSEMQQYDQILEQEKLREKERIVLKQKPFKKHWEESNFIQNQNIKYFNLLNNLQEKREQKSDNLEKDVLNNLQFINRQKTQYQKQLQRIQKI